MYEHVARAPSVSSLVISRLSRRTTGMPKSGIENVPAAESLSPAPFRCTDKAKKEPSRHECFYSLHLPCPARPCHAMPCCVALFLCPCQDLCSSVEPEGRMLVQGWIPEIRLHVIVLLLPPFQTNHLLDRSALFSVYCTVTVSKRPSPRPGPLLSPPD
jgi:hypothetical protein